MIDCFIHELVHSALLAIFKNGFEPYFSTDDSIRKRTLDKLIDHVTPEKLKDTPYTRSYGYEIEYYSSEIPAYYYGEMAGKLLDKNYLKDILSLTDVSIIQEWIEKYLHQSISKSAVIIDTLEPYLVNLDSQIMTTILSFDSEILLGDSN